MLKQWENFLYFTEFIDVRNVRELGCMIPLWDFLCCPLRIFFNYGAESSSVNWRLSSSWSGIYLSKYHQKNQSNQTLAFYILYPMLPKKMKHFICKWISFRLNAAIGIFIIHIYITSNKLLESLHFFKNSLKWNMFVIFK